MKEKGEIQWRERSGHHGECWKHYSVSVSCCMPWSPSSSSPKAAPQQDQCCGTGCVESGRRLGAGGTRLHSKCVNKSIFKWEAVREGKLPRAGLFCCRQGLARGLKVEVQVLAFPSCLLVGGSSAVVSRSRSAAEEVWGPCRLLLFQLHVPPSGQDCLLGPA